MPARFYVCPALIETELDREIVHFCYPAGRCGPLAEALARETYRSATMTVVGSLPRGPVDRYHLPRMSGQACRDTTLWALARAPRALAIPDATA